MGKFSKIFHHIETKDLRNKYEQKKAAKIEEEKKKEDTKKYVASAMENVKYNWRSKIDVGETIREGMTTSDVATISTPANPDEVLNDTPLDNADDFAPGAKGDVADFYDGTVGTSIKSGGSGSGNNGGFDIGNHLAFDGDGSTDGARWMITKPIDTTNLDHIVMSIITGNDSNGGETPDDSSEGLYLYYKTPEMNDFIPINYFPTFTGDGYRGGDIGYPDEDKLFNTVDGPTFVNMTIIPVGGGSPTLQDYTKYIPSYARGKDTQFLLYQFVSSGTGKDNYGVKNISYRRKYPIQVVAPLDTPEASSFIRGADQSSTPKKRKKDVDDKLEASDEYTTAKFGNEFPGQEVRVGGEDPFKGAKIGDDVEPSPQGKDEVKKSFGDFNATSKDTTEKQKASEVEKLTGELNDVYDNPDTTLEDFTSDENVARVERILELDPNNIDALHMRSFISSINGDQDAAIMDAERAYEVDPDNEFTKPMLEYAYDDKISTTWGAAETMADLMNDTELMDTLDKAIKLNPDNSLNYWYRSQINEADQNYDAVVEDLEKMLEINPEDAETELRLGDIKQKQAEKLEREQKTEATKKKEEAKELQEKGVSDYYDDPGFEFENEIEPVEVSSWDKNDTSNKIIDLYKADYETAKATIANLPKQSESIGATYNGDNIDYIHLSQINKNIENRDVRFRSPESMSQEELQRSLISLSLEIEDQKYWVNDLGRKKGSANWIIGAPNYVLNNTKFTGEITGITSKEVEAEYDKLDAMVDERGMFQGNWREQLGKANEMSKSLTADAEIKKLNAEQYQLVTQYNKLYNAFMGEVPDPTTFNLPETIQKFTDDEELFNKLKTETKLENDILKKVLGKMLDAFKDKRDVILAIKKWAVVDMANADAYMENWAIQIALSMLTNTPIRIDESSIPDTYKKSFARNINPGYFVKDPNEPNKNFIPIVEEEVLYADDNFYIDEDGNTVSNIGPNGEKGFYKKDTTLQVFSVNGTRTTNIFQASPTNPLIKDPLSTIGKMQFQVIYPKKGEPYMLVKDHAYWNMESDDPNEIGGEANNLGDRVKNTMLTGFAYTAAALSAGANLRWFGQENFGNMKGYPKNIRGDVVTRFEIPFNLLSPDVQKYIENNKPGAEEGTFDDEGNYIPPGFEDPIGTDEIGKPEIDPFETEVKPNLGGEDGDDIALFGKKPPNPNEKQGRATHINIINWWQSGGSMGTKPEGWSEQDVQNYINRFYLNKSSSTKPNDTDLGSVTSVGGVDATSAATVAATTKKKKKKTTMVAGFKPSGKSLFERVSKIRKSNEFFNQGDIKPEFPENPPPKLDPKTGMHPEYGKKANRYKKLDPHSANAMPPTGDPEIDAVVNKQKTINKIKKMAKKA